MVSQDEILWPHWPYSTSQSKKKKVNLLEVDSRIKIGFIFMHKVISKTVYDDLDLLCIYFYVHLLFRSLVHPELEFDGFTTNFF